MVVAQVYPLTRIEEVLAASGPSGRFVTLSYSPTTGRLAQVQASDGRTVGYAHDSHQSATRGNLVQVCPLRPRRAELPHARGALVEPGDARGAEPRAPEGDQLGYDLDGNLVSRSVTLAGPPAETVTGISYDPAGFLASGVERKDDVGARHDAV